MSTAYGEHWILVLLVSAILTWGVGLAPPLIIRFAIIRKPLSRRWAIAAVVALLIVNIGIFASLGTTSKTHSGLMLVAIASYFILRRRARPSELSRSQRSSEHTSKEAPSKSADSPGQDTVVEVSPGRADRATPIRNQEAADADGALRPVAAGPFQGRVQDPTSALPLRHAWLVILLLIALTSIALWALQTQVFRPLSEARASIAWLQDDQRFRQFVADTEGPPAPSDNYYDKLVQQMVQKEIQSAGGPAAYRQRELEEAQSREQNAIAAAPPILSLWFVSIALIVGTALLIHELPSGSLVAGWSALRNLASKIAASAVAVAGVYVAASTLEDGWLEDYRALGLALAAALGLTSWHLFRRRSPGRSEA